VNAVKSAAAVLAAALAGCGADDGTAPATAPTVKLPTRAPSVGPEARHRPPSLGPRAARGVPIAGMRCTKAQSPRFGVHLELFAARRVVLVAPGIAIAPPRKGDGAYVHGGRCSYPVRTREPTGVIEVEARGSEKTLGQLFAVWGQPLGRTRMAGFGGRVHAYVDGRRWRGGPAAIPLRMHAQIVLEVGGYVRPHASYRFPPGL
jgi:hypothetical protein